MARERKFTTEELYRETEAALLQYGYEGFTFSMLAEKIGISRSALYKYYTNKDELISEFMLDKMEQFLQDMKAIRHQGGFIEQYECLLELIFKNSTLHHIIGLSHHLRLSRNKIIKERISLLDQQHVGMYAELQDLIRLGKEAGKLKPHIPDMLILGFIFQAIAIPNHSGIDHGEWMRSVKEILESGIMINGI